MSQTIIPAEQHVHLDLDFDVQHKFHYRTRGRDGRRVVLRRGGTVTFTCADDFYIRFVTTSPFTEPMPCEHRSLVAARVRSDAPCGPYDYVLEIRKEGRLFTDPQPGDDSREPPRIVIEE
jgi:hypothetical protein